MITLNLDPAAIGVVVVRGVQVTNEGLVVACPRDTSKSDMSR